MLDINFLEKSWYFKKISIKTWDVLFNEWDKDNNLYIIISWKISIEKNIIQNDKTRRRKLSTLLIFDIIWESSTNWNERNKQVNAIAISNTILLKIGCQEKIKEFFLKFPLEWIKLLKHIIFISNKRLLKINREITTNYEINKNISEIKNINFESIFEIIEKMKELMLCTYILLFEKSPSFKDYYILRYDTRLKWKIQDNIIEIKEWDSEIKILKSSDINLDIFNLINKLKIWNDELWFIVVWRKNNIFNESEKNILISMSNSLSWIIRQKSIIQEEKNKNFMKNK